VEAVILLHLTLGGGKDPPPPVGRRHPPPLFCLKYFKMFFNINLCFEHVYTPLNNFYTPPQFQIPEITLIGSDLLKIYYRCDRPLVPLSNSSNVVLLAKNDVHAERLVNRYKLI